MLPTADVLLAPREETLSDLLLNGGERIALAEFGTIQVPPEPMPVQAPPGPPSRGLCVRWPGRCAASRHTGMRHRPAGAGNGPERGAGTPHRTPAWDPLN